jgi:hypothetical protein
LASRSAPPTAHFRAHDRRQVRLTVEVVGQRSGSARPAVVVDLSLAGAGLETDEPLLAGDRLSITLSTPTTWDPLVIEGVVAWADSARMSTGAGSFGRSRTIARAGVAFDYPAPAAVLAMFEMLTTLGYE